MSDLPVERDESGRFVKQQAEDQVRPDLEQDYHPLAVTLFGWTRSARVPLICLLLTALILFAVIALSASGQTVSGGLLSITGFYAAVGVVSGLVIAVIGTILVTALGRDEDYYGEADTLPDDAEEMI